MTYAPAVARQNHSPASDDKHHIRVSAKALPASSNRGLTGTGLSRPSAEADQPEAADYQRSQGEDAEDRDPDSARHPREACELVGVRALGSAPSTLAMQFHYRPDATEEQKPGHRVAEPGLNQCRRIQADDGKGGPGGQHSQHAVRVADRDRQPGEN